MTVRDMFMCACALLFGGCGDEGSSPKGGTAGSTVTPSTTAVVGTADGSTSEGDDVTGQSSTEQGSTTAAPTSTPIVPGEGVGDVRVGDRWADLVGPLGDPDSTLRFGGLVVGTFSSAQLEVLFAAPAQIELDPDSLALSVAVRASETITFSGPATPGASRGDIEDALGVAQEEIESVAYYTAGLSVTYDEADVATTIGVFAPYEIRTAPPVMVGFEEAR